MLFFFLIIEIEQAKYKSQEKKGMMMLISRTECLPLNHHAGLLIALSLLCSAGGMLLARLWIRPYPRTRRVSTSQCDAGTSRLLMAS